MNIEVLYGIALIVAIVIGVAAVKNNWKIADYF
jgi:hypothetical protein